MSVVELASAGSRIANIGAFLSYGFATHFESSAPLCYNRMFRVARRALSVVSLLNGSCPRRNRLDFQLSDEQLQLKKMVRDFAEREIAPNVMKWDEPGSFPLDTIKELGKLGLMGTIFPTEYGGAGMGYVEYVTAVEELSRVDGSVGITVAAHTSLCSNHVFLAGNET